MKKVLSIFLIIVSAISIFIGNITYSFADNLPTISAPYAVLMDYETGQVLYEKNGDQRVYPASTTKMWTAYVVLKHVDDLSQRVRIENLEPIDGTSMYLQNGESFTVKELLQGLMITSANDAAVVLARFVSGNEQEFANLMNEEAKKIGAKNTHFNNPNGLPDENHYTTAYDMALMSREAMSNETFREIVSQERVFFQQDETTFVARDFVNTNKFISGTSNEKMMYNNQLIDIKYPIVDGIKTGFTNDAGKCLLSSALKNDMRLISAVFKTTGNTNMYIDSRTLLDYGFNNFKSTTIVQKEEYSNSKKVFFSKQKTLNYEPKSGYKLVLPKDEKVEQYSVKEILKDINLPIKKGDVVGSLEVYKNNELESTIDLIATNDVESILPFFNKNVLLSIVKILLVLILLIPISLILLKKYLNRYRKNKRNRFYRNNKNIYINKKSKNINFKNNRWYK